MGEGPKALVILIFRLKGGERERMRRIRFLRSEYSYAEFSTVVSPAVERAVEEREAPCTALLNFFPQDSITLGYFEDPEKSLDLQYCRLRGIQVCRRRNTGGSILGGKGSAFLVLCLDVSQDRRFMPTLEQGFRCSLTAMAEAMGEFWGLDAKWRPLNDVEAGGKKLVASSARLEKDVLTLRLVINAAPVDPSLLKNAIKTPAEKMRDKQVQDPAQRVSSLEQELGRSVGQEEILALVRRSIGKMFDWDVLLVPGELNILEKQYAKEFEKMLSSEEWFWGRSESRRSDSVSPGCRRVEGLHKAPAGLIRVTLWVQENAIQDLLITGDFHARPLELVERLEAELRGVEADLEAVSSKVLPLLERPGVELPGVGKEDLLAPFVQALQKLRWKRGSCMP